MQQTLTLLAGDSKQRENKGGGWETKSEEKGGGPRRGRATSTPDFMCRGQSFSAASIVFPFHFCLFAFADLAVSLAPRGPVMLAQWVPGCTLSAHLCSSLTESLHMVSTWGLRLNPNLFFFFLNYFPRNKGQGQESLKWLCCEMTNGSCAKVKLNQSGGPVSEQVT